MQSAQRGRMGWGPRAVLACASLACAVAAAQSPPPAVSAPPSATQRALPSPDQLEPGVNTTPAAPAAAPPAPDAPAGGGAAAPAGKARTDGSPVRKGPERLELEATEITGNRELPKVLYIVPWKRSDLGDLVGKPVNSLLDEVLQPLDRDVFRRENRYYDALKPEQAAPKTGAAQGSEGKP